MKPVFTVIDFTFEPFRVVFSHFIVSDTYISVGAWLIWAEEDVALTIVASVVCVCKTLLHMEVGAAF